MTREEIADYTAGYDDCMADMKQTIDKIKSEVLTIPQIDSDGHSGNWYREPQAIINDVLKIIDKYIGDKE